MEPRWNFKVLASQKNKASPSHLDLSLAGDRKPSLFPALRPRLSSDWTVTAWLCQWHRVSLNPTDMVWDFKAIGMLFAVFHLQASLELIWKEKSYPIPHSSIAENPKCFISWLIYFVIIDLLVNSTIIFFHFAYLCCLYSKCFHTGVIAVHERSSLTALIQIKLSVLLMYPHRFMHNLDSSEGFFKDERKCI